MNGYDYVERYTKPVSIGYSQFDLSAVRKLIGGAEPALVTIELLQDGVWYVSSNLISTSSIMVESRISEIWDMANDAITKIQSRGTLGWPVIDVYREMLDDMEYQFWVSDTEGETFVATARSTTYRVRANNKLQAAQFTQSVIGMITGRIEVYSTGLNGTGQEFIATLGNPIAPYCG